MSFDNKDLSSVLSDLIEKRKMDKYRNTPKTYQIQFNPYLSINRIHSINDKEYSLNKNKQNNYKDKYQQENTNLTKFNI